ncbi:helix-turn-helix domain-containing protein [Cesiribacter sp. SM1]|uniref:helix-turn-helix domain-containing protein n=1 Tax=Cesiribacter sp. SM1 TaxID=2861196 RepID=UPI001CD7E29F|nr:helix-turn-helix transcriptional regulator [Cesiribacter sp. SM1]
MKKNSSDLSKVNDRIKYFQDEILKVSANRFAKEVGIAYGTLRNLYAEDKAPRKGTIQKILEAYDGFINPAWLQSGKGRPTLSATQEHPAFQLMTSDEHWPKVGRQVRKLIRKSEKSPEEIAQATGLSMYAMNKTLSGKQSPTPQFMSVLLSELGVTVDQLAQKAGVAVPQQQKEKEKPEKAVTKADEEQVTAEEQSLEDAQPEQQQAATAQIEPQQPQQATAPVPVQQPQTYPVQQPYAAAVDHEGVQELRMKIDFLTNRINYLEERLSRLAR